MTLAARRREGMAALTRSGKSLMVLTLLALLDCTPAPPVAARPLSLFDRRSQWTDENGATVSFARWSGIPVVVTAIYTSCTVRCPLTVEKLRALDAAFRRKGVNSEFVLITLDPRVDQPARLRRYKEARHLPPSWHLLEGDLEQTQSLARMLGVRAAYDEGHIDHDVRIAVFDAAGRLVRTFVGWDFDEDKAADGR